MKHESLGEQQKEVISPIHMHLKLGAAALPYYLQDAAKVILSGSKECPLPEGAGQKDHENLFLQTLSQGVNLDDNYRPHFFLPKTYLQYTGQSISRVRVKNHSVANGLNDIVTAKNYPEVKDDPEVQKEAEAAMREYLDYDLFKNDLHLDTEEIIGLYGMLSPEAQSDPELNKCLIEAHNKRLEMARLRHEAAERRKMQMIEEAPRYYKPNTNSFKAGPKTTIDQLLEKLRRSQNKEGFERVNALKKWGDFIKENLPNANYEERVISFGNRAHVGDRRAKYSDDDTYAAIAFDFAGRRCMIAEASGSGGASSTTAAMKVWRSEPGKLGDKHGWVRAFATTKTGASEYGDFKDIRHVDVGAEVSQRETNDENYIVEAEDRLFRLAFHYFETGELPGNSQKTAKRLDEMIGPQVRRPNAKPAEMERQGKK